MKQEKKSLIWNNFFVQAIVIFVVLVAVTYLLVNVLSKKNKYVCKFIGNFWFNEVQSTEIPNPKVGCYSYMDVY
ncbi:MAG TPA: hypothetical protein VI819_05670 [Patescibacteria group bacterium]|nr:hypothetical protein [Patescibacteria group bacterium]